jgi:2-iminobutanoate/2-iminopropanoate deaminase
VSALACITDAHAATPVGPYSHAVKANGLVFVSGQAGWDSAADRLAGPDVESQTRQALANIRTILQAAGSDLHRVIRCGVFLTDMRDFERMNAVYASVFDGHRPARTTVQVAGLPRPGLVVEIDAVALDGL